VLFFQRLLRAEGLYAGALDGEWGPDTEKAAQEFERHTEQFRLELRTFDSRSEQNIVTLSLKAQRAARLFLGRVLDGGLIVRIISGTEPTRNRMRCSGGAVTETPDRS
jgi:peptidoglycan LD-endopeptidase CwlK